MVRIKYVISVMLLLTMISCGVSRIQVSAIKSNPDLYRGKTVKIEGIIDSILSIPLVNIKAFQLNDEGEKIWVLGPAPGKKGDMASVIGTVDVAVKIGEMNLGTIIRLEDR